MMKPRPSMQTVTVRVETAPFEGLARMCCPSCGSPWDLCQPDANQPHLFLATCPDCQEWYLIVLTDDGDARAISLSALKDLKTGPEVSLKLRKPPSATK